MPAVFVIDRSATEPSPLVQRLICEGYHVLCLADCRTALETLRCVRPALMLVDVAARSRAAAQGLLKILARDGGPRPSVPVIVVGASVDDYRVLAGLMVDGEIVPRASSSPEEVARRVGRYVLPAWPARPAVSY